MDGSDKVRYMAGSGGCFCSRGEPSQPPPTYSLRTWGPWTSSKKYSTWPCSSAKMQDYRSFKHCYKALHDLVPACLSNLNVTVLRLVHGFTTLACPSPNRASPCPPQGICPCCFLRLGHSPGTFAWQVSGERSPLS